MPIDAVRTRDPGRFRNSRPQRYVRAAPIVENDELLKYGPQMALTDWNQVVETLSPKTSDQVLAKSIALRAPRGSSLHERHQPRKSNRGRESGYGTRAHNQRTRETIG